jgi:uroporphyrinogen decarboxylase
LIWPKFCFSRSSACFIAKITDTTIAYLKEKVKAGVMPCKFLTLGAGCLQWIIKILMEIHQQIIEALADVTPVIVLERMLVCFERNGKSKASALGVGGRAHQNARYLSGGNITLQGNF